mgnify:CR=1 FL=1
MAAQRIITDLTQYRKDTYKVNDLLNILRHINNGRIEVTTEKVEGSIQTYINDEVSDLVDSMACQVLIQTDGRVNYGNAKILYKEGFDIIPLEKDSFGWLVGGIVTKKGIIKFG